MNVVVNYLFQFHRLPGWSLGKRVHDFERVNEPVARIARLEAV